ncbi:MAG: hypothetical protein B6I23_03125 [Rickettsiaceae bacterium 4572_127]|nr:MAG: hypothetical protein B6I23_03125 [Rickettsiaceae bacterium 4572_127]
MPMYVDPLKTFLKITEVLEDTVSAEGKYSKTPKTTRERLLGVKGYFHQINIGEFPKELKKRFMKVKEKLESGSFNDSEMDSLIRNIWKIDCYLSDKNERYLSSVSSD